MQQPDTAVRMARIWPYFRRYLPYLRPDRGPYWLLLLVVFGVAVTNTALIWVIGQPLNLLGQQRYDALWDMLMVFGALVLINQAFHFISTLGMNWIGLRFVGRVRSAVMAHMLAVSFPVAGQHTKGDLLARLSHDADRIEGLVVEVPMFLTSHLVTIVLYCAMLVWLDPVLALMALALTPLFALHQRFFAPRKRRAAQGFFERNARLLAYEEEALANLRGISAFTAEPEVGRRHRDTFERARRWAMKERWLDVTFSSSFSLLIFLSGLAILAAGLARVVDGELAVGGLVSFLLYLGYLSVPITGMVQVPFQMQGDAAAAERVSELLDSATLVDTPADARPLAVTQGDIAAKGLVFGYPDGTPVFKGLDLHIKGGETVALVGPSGTGKSTFAKLLLRFYDPQQGVLAIDGVDVRQVTLESLRRQVAVVWQGPVIINDSVRANLLMARPEADDAALEAACRAGHVWDVIQGLPQGLDTPLGAGGVELSAGQAQRLAIAQAYLRDAPILILDEPTSALDSESERHIVQGIDNLRGGRTTLIIAHRYSSIQSADRIVYFNDDGTVTVGQHQELMASHPGYQEAVQWQLGGSSRG